MPSKPDPDNMTILLIRPTLKIAGGFISVCHLGHDLAETEVRKLEVASTPDHEWPGLFELVDAQITSGQRLFVVDLRKVPWMNSRGLGRLIELWQHIEAAGGKAALVCAPGRILTILEISQVTLIMNPVQNLEDAVQVLTGKN